MNKLIEKSVFYILLFGLITILTACGGSSSSSTVNAEANSQYAYITDGSSMKIIDITNASTPVLKGSVPTTSSFKVVVSGSFAYVSEFASSDPYVNIIDIEDVTSPFLETAIPKDSLFGRVSDMYIENNIAYVSDEYRGIHILDINNGIFDPQTQTASDAMSVTKMGSELFLIFQGSAPGLTKFDVTTPYVLTPTSIQNIVDINANSYPSQTETHHSIVEHDGTNIIVANVSDNKLKKLDTNLVLLAEVDISGYATALAVSGNYAYVTMHAGLNAPLLNSDDAVKIIDLTTMSVVSTATLSQASGVAFFEDKLYVTDSTGLHIYDVSNGILNLLNDFAAGAGNAIALGEDKGGSGAVQ